MTSRDEPPLRSFSEVWGQEYGQLFTDRIASSEGAPVHSSQYWQGVFDAFPEHLRTLDMQIVLPLRPQEGEQHPAALLLDAVLQACEYMTLHEKEVSPARLRAQLKGVSKACDGLLKELAALHPILRVLLSGDPSGENEQTRQVDESEIARSWDCVATLAELLATVQRRADWETQVGIARQQRGRSRAWFRKLSMFVLVQGWEQHTGIPATYTYNPYSEALKNDDKYEGSFLDFADAVFRPLMGRSFRRRTFANFISKEYRPRNAKERRELRK